MVRLAVVNGVRPDADQDRVDLEVFDGSKALSDRATNADGGQALLGVALVLEVQGDQYFHCGALVLSPG